MANNNISKMEQKYNEYVSNMGQNFKDKFRIFSVYNQSIGNYMRFRTKITEGLYNEAAEELTNAAMKLAAVVEWSEKYLIYNYYDKKIKSEPNSTQISDWEKKREFKKNNGSLMTTHELFNLIRQDFQQEINDSNIIIDKLDDARVRNNLINGYKHNGDQPDSSSYIQTLNELYVFIKGLIDKNCELKSITDTFSDSWEEFFVSCDYFQTNGNHHYILLTDCIDDENIIKNIFRIRWDMVLDLSYSGNNRLDLYDQYIALENISSVNKKYLCDFKNTDNLLISPKTYWIKINGRENAEKNSEKILDDRNLAAYYIRNQFEYLIKSFAREYTGEIELIVLGCSEFSQSARRILQIIGDEFLNKSSLTVHLLDCGNNEIVNAIRSNNSIDESVCKFYKLTAEEAARQIEINICEYNKISEDKIKIPNGNINFDNYQTMKSVMDIVYIGIEQNVSADEKKAHGLAYLKGEIPASWDIINDSGYVIPYRNELNIRDEIIHNIQDGSRNVLQIRYEAGLGGTTFLRKLAFLLHDNYPTVLINRYVEKELVSFLLEIYKISKTGIVILADSNTIELSEVNKLQNELLQDSQFTFVIVYVSRNEIQTDYDPHNEAGRRLARFDFEQCENLKDNLLPFIDTSTRCKENLLKCLGRIKNDPRGEDSIPFVLSMYAFDQEFQGIKPYVKHTMQGLDKDDREILLVLALADYVNYGVSEQYFRSIYGQPKSKLMTYSTYKLAPLIKIFCDSSGKKKSFRIKYSLFSKPILEELSGNDKFSFTLISDRIIEMIDNSRCNIYAEPDEEILKLLNRLFIDREGEQGDDDTINGRGKYSPVITKLIDENREINSNQYDDSENIVVKIFKELMKVYPEQPHFAGHLARFYFYTLKNYDEGFEIIENAIISAKELDSYPMGSLYHINAMGYSAKIQNNYISQIREVIRHSKKVNDKNDDLFEVINYINNINNDFAEAGKCFDNARTEETNHFVSNIAQCDLILKILGCYSEIKRWCADCQLDNPISESNRLQLSDQLDNLIDDSEMALTIEKGEYHSTHEKELDRVKEDRELSLANDETTEKICNQIIQEGKSDMVYVARRKLARIKNNKASQDIDSPEAQSIFGDIVSMMEANFESDPSNNANFRIWFNALRKIQMKDPSEELNVVFEKLEYWTSLEQTSVDAYYYKYIVKFILAFEDGTLNISSEVQDDLNNLLSDLTNMSKNISKKTIPVDWLSAYGKGLRRLVSSEDLNKLDKQNALLTLNMFTGVLPSKEKFNNRSAYIKLGKQKVYFNPQSINDRINASNENQYVDFGLGFSYDGLRAYHDSIEIHKGAISSEREELKPGGKVRVKVIKKHNDFIITQILPGNLGRCDIHIQEYAKIGYSTDPKNGQELEVILDHTTILNSGEKVWRIKVPNSDASNDKRKFNQPFENLLKDIKLEN